MPIVPTRDRTISLTLESALRNTPNKKVSTKASDKYVSKFIPNSGITGFIAKKSGLESATIVLQGPTRINIGLTADIGNDPGIFTSFLQPWFIKNIPVRIDGESYLGAYTGISVGDRDAERLLKKFRDTLNDFSHDGQYSKERILLEIKGGPQGTRRFLGYIQKLDLTEDIRNPYFLNYSLDFIGRNVDNAALSQGRADALKELNRTRGKQ